MTLIIMQNNKIKTNNTTMKSFFEFIKTLITAFIIAFLITRFIVPTVVVGESMYPTFDNKDYLLVNKIAYANSHPNTGDVILFNMNDEKVLIKRVIASQDDKLVIKDSEVYVNDKKIEESYINEDSFEADINIIIPKNKVFVMGDNRNNSMDSRVSMVGLVDESELIGKAFIRLLPDISIIKNPIL